MRLGGEVVDLTNRLHQRTQEYAGGFDVAVVYPFLDLSLLLELVPPRGYPSYLAMVLDSSNDCDVALLVASEGDIKQRDTLGDLRWLFEVVMTVSYQMDRCLLRIPYPARDWSE